MSLRNSMPSFRYDVVPAALAHAAEYMNRTGQIDKVVDTSKLLLVAR